jgi:sugar lactone lactonase YvrE
MPQVRTAKRAVSAAVIAGLLVLPASSDDKSRKQTKTAPAGELVWPLPPDPPRVRWVGQINDLDEVKGKGNGRSWMERLAGPQGAYDVRAVLQRPYGVAVDSQGRIFVADSAQRAVYILDQANKRVEVRRGASRAPLALPIGVALDEEDRLFVSDSFLHQVVCFDKDGKQLATFGRDKLERAAGLALDRDRHRLYVVDAKAHRIAVFNSANFTFQRYIGAPNSAKGAADPGHFAIPSNVAVDRRGNLYVTDSFNFRIQIFDPEGKFVRAFGTHGDRPGSFARPKGIAVDSEGHIYVADAEFNNFQIFSDKGETLLAVGGMGSEPGQFILIAGLCIDRNDRILTTEQETGRVQIFQYLHAPGQKEVTRAAK